MCERTEFLPIGTHVNLILNRLRLQRALMECCEDLESDNAKRKDTTEQTEKPKRDPKEECEYIKERLRQIAKFEQRYKGKT
jgi:hypothetical protein